MSTQTIYQKTIKFATLKHLEKAQTIPGTNMPYVVHLSNVAMEILIAAQHSADFDLDFAVQLALLHDTLEDTSTTLEELTERFSLEISEGVLALTKDDDLPAEEKMRDSLNRIKKQRTEVWAVKLADRITNLQVPPMHWDQQKKKKYREEAKVILETLKGGNSYLEKRLAGKIEEYESYI
ncbi:HD domain-containing protein [Pedobacter cryoconitis]|uniref:Guanosine-3',5'-bis(Diphosphate) 3'-pyrophosphohydrolase n=1 Tax=Pedobacter cryoconitis TaxID=188932 RepID=A0A7X0MHG0_9SPHI|nr:HD domain-containing protein [Pedobacter cryoconitis]MBB6498811.1 guanosine-3',5'-bis(diphosphate) 3'-pyrophosphohydrolase [Pedobacter cryoconitis]